MRQREPTTFEDRARPLSVSSISSEPHPLHKELADSRREHLEPRRTRRIVRGGDRLVLIIDAPVTLATESALSGSTVPEATGQTTMRFPLLLLFLSWHI